MKITTLIMFVCFMQLSAKVHSQISISEKNVPITSVLAKIQQQSGYNLFYESTKIKDVKIDVKLDNVSVKEALDKVLGTHDLAYSIVDRTIVVKLKESSFIDKVVDALTPPIDVVGLVLDEKGNPLAGATVRVKGSRWSTTTNSIGQFSIQNVDDEASLLISYIGYQDKEVAIEKNITVRLDVKSAELNEVVVAYGRQQQKSITGSVSVVTGDQIQGLPNRSFDKSLQGLVPGLVVTRAGGQPGGGVSNFILRGIATGGDPTGGNPVRNPLIIIDGVPVSQSPSMRVGVGTDANAYVSNPLAQLNPNDIESISVLKDASAIALYGSKASNGVILVSTKRGKIGKTRFMFSHQTDIANRENNDIQMLNQQQYIDLFVETYQSSNPGTSRELVISKLKQEFPIRSDGNFFPELNWMDAISNKAAQTNATNLSISGGSEKESFYVGLERTSENGVIRNSGYNRNSFRINYDGRPSNWFKYGFNTALSYNVQDFSDPSLIKKAQFMSPLNPLYNEEGNMIYNFKYGHSGFKNGEYNASPLAEITLNTNQNKAYRAISNGFLEGRFLKYFTLSSSAGFDFMLNEGKIKRYPKVAYDDGYGSTMLDGKLEWNSNRTSNIIFTNTLAINQSFATYHSLNVLFGQEIQISENSDAIAVTTAFENNPALEDVNGGILNNAGQSSGKQNSVSYFSQVNYGFKDRYFASGSIRRDGSSRFGASNRYGTFWSAGLAYVLSEEPFLKRNSSWLNYAKLRASFGPAGNSAAIQDFYRLSLIVPAEFLDNPAVKPSDWRQPNGNAGIKWEDTFTWNAGMELRLLNNRISTTVELYKRKTKNFIAEVPMGHASGFTIYWANIGDMLNKGLEVSVSADLLRKRSFGWSLAANWSRNTNKLTKSFYPETNMGGTINRVGEEYNSFYQPVWAGIDPTTGRPQWIAKDQSVTTDYRNGRDYRIVGKSQPDGTGSLVNTFTHKYFALTFNFYFSYGSTIQGSNVFVNDGKDPYINQSIAALNHWRSPGDVNTNPRRLFMAGFGGIQEDFGVDPSTRYFFDGDFIRLSNVRLGYSFPKELLKSLYLDGLNLFVQGNNLALWTKYSGSDPENINAFGNGQGFLYPQARIYSAGINVSF